MLLSKRYKDIIEQVHSDICNHCLTDVSIGQIARKYGIERDKLVFYFKQIYGISLYDFLNNPVEIHPTKTQSQAERKMLNMIRGMKRSLLYIYSRIVKRRTSSRMYCQF